MKSGCHIQRYWKFLLRALVAAFCAKDTLWRHWGKDIAIVLKEAAEWAKKGEKIVARVLAVKDREIQLKWKEQTLSLNWEMIKKANLKEEIKV